MDRVLVTGGAGAIGSHVVRQLLAAGSRVVVVDDLSSGRADNVPADADLIEMSICDAGLEQALSSADVVIHLAAKFANQNSIDHPIEDADVNAVGTLRLLELCRRHRPDMRIAYASTSCVGQVKTPYAVSKKAGEDYALLYAELFGMRINVVRFFNSYGPFDFPGQYRSVIPNFLDTALRGEPLTVMGTGEETRDFTWVGDSARAVIGAASASSWGHVLEVGTGVSTSVRELAELVNAIAHNGAGIEYRPRRGWDTVDSRRANTSAIQNVLGFVPSTPLEDGLRGTCAWMRSYVHGR
jgi:UDP-glucose 4-epimerase